MRYEAKLTSKGQLTLPAPLRAALRLKPGDKVAFVEDPATGRVTLEARRHTFADLLGIVKLDRPVSTEEILDWVREARDERADHHLKAAGIKFKPRDGDA